MTKSETMNADMNNVNVRNVSELSWDQLNWKQLDKSVRRIQARIVKAHEQGRTGKVKSLSYVLVRSFAAKALAVKQVSSNKGAETPGVDGVVWKTPRQKLEAILDLNPDNYKAKPLRRKYIKKTNSNKMRPLGIPTMKDRAMQALYALALLPVAETTADTTSFGFRPKRSVADAIEQVFKVLGNRTRPCWILEGDIKSCFDNISHDWILENIPVERHILRQWLKSGYLENGTFNHTEAGTPQGGVISPIVANMVLDGIEKLIRDRYKVKCFSKGKIEWRPPKKEKNKRINLVRYADDFVITGISKDVLEDEIKPMIQEFLKERGLELSEEKTLITHVDDGFDFLGFNIRAYNGKMLIKPTKKNVQRLIQKVGEITRQHRTATAEKLVVKLNPVLRGWANFYRHVVSKRTFSKVDHLVWEKLWMWAKRRHPNKGKGWVKQKYFTRIGNRSYIFFGTNEKGQKVTLFNVPGVRIRRHLKIQNTANPYASEWKEYFAARAKMDNERL